MNKFLSTIAGAALGMAVFVAPASAGLMIVVSDGVNSDTFTDQSNDNDFVNNSFGDLNLLNTGNLTIAGGSNLEGGGSWFDTGWFFDMTAISSDGEFGALLNSVTGSATGGTGELTFTIYDDYSALDGLARASTGITPTTTPDTDFTSYIDLLNGGGVQDILIGSTTGLTSGDEFGSGVNGIDLSAAYRLVQVITIDHDDASDLSQFDATTTTSNLPEPAALGFLGLGLVGLGFARRRKQRAA